MPHPCTCRVKSKFPLLALEALGIQPQWYLQTHFPPLLPTHPNSTFSQYSTFFKLSEYYAVPSAWQALLPLECLENLSLSIKNLFKCHTLTKASLMLFLSHHQWSFSPWCFSNFIQTLILIKSWYFSYDPVMIYLPVCSIAFAINCEHSEVRDQGLPYLCH